MGRRPRWGWLTCHALHMGVRNNCRNGHQKMLFCYASQLLAFRCLIDDEAQRAYMVQQNLLYVDTKKAQISVLLV